MSKTTKIVLGVIGGVIVLCLVSAASAGAGFLFSRIGTPIGLASAAAIRPFVQVEPEDFDRPYRMPMYGQGRGYRDGDCPYQEVCPRSPDGGGWRGTSPDEFRMPFGMFGFDPEDGFRMPFGMFGIDPQDRFGLGGMMGPGGMMGGFAWNTDPSAEPLTVEQAVAAAEAYLEGIEATDLQVAEVMVFDNHAYVEIKDPKSDEGAIELLVDPVSQRAMLEFGPSMMWNTRYGMHALMGMRGGMMGQFPGPEAVLGEMTVTPEQALAAAEEYLAQAFPGRTVGEEVETFPGYYTLHVMQDGEVVGMLSVNGYTGQVWYHQWHGELLEMQEFGE